MKYSPQTVDGLKTVVNGDLKPKCGRFPRHQKTRGMVPCQQKLGVGFHVTKRPGVWFPGQQKLGVDRTTLSNSSRRSRDGWGPA